jgi:hypothetical protein
MLAMLVQNVCDVKPFRPIATKPSFTQPGRSER